MAIRERVGTWAARPGYRVLLRQDGPLGRPLLWVPLVPGGPRVNEVSEQALTYSNLTVNTGISGAGGGFYDFNGTNSAVTFTNPRDPLTPTSTLAASTPVTLTWLQRYDTQSNSYPFVWSIYFNSITSFVCFQSPSDGSYYFVAGVAGSNTPSFSSGHGAPVVGRVNRYVLTAANGLGSTSGFVMWRDGVRFTSPGTAATSDGLTGSSKIGGRSSDNTFNWSGVIADAGIFAGVASDAAIEQFFDRPYDGLYQPPRIVVPVSAGGGSVEVGLATETDSAKVITPGQAKTVGGAAETDAAQAIAPASSQSVGIAQELDTAGAIQAAQAGVVGAASEADSAQAVSAAQANAVAAASEVDAAGAIGAAQSAPIGQATEADAAAAISAAQALALGGATELDQAQAITATGSGGSMINAAAEVDAAHPVQAAQALAVGAASESSAAKVISPTAQLALGHASETDIGHPIAIGQSLAIGTATELSIAKAITATASGGGAGAADVWNYILSNGLTAEQTVVQIHAMLTLLTSGPIDVNVVRMNNAQVIGTGQIGDQWRGVGVPP